MNFLRLRTWGSSGLVAAKGTANECPRRIPQERRAPSAWRCGVERLCPVGYILEGLGLRLEALGLRPEALGLRP